jgi:5-methylcytosine-specific restriction endonuclease McrA
MYVLESDRQIPAHDRRIDDRVRRTVLVRDNHTCQECGWSHERWTPSDPRHLELHHMEHHVTGGSNEADNLKTLCNVCHDQQHINASA